MENFQLENKDSIQIKASNAIRKAILRGDFAPGSKLVQDQLAKQLGISRMPIREALKQLEIEGLVRIEPYRGAFVSEIDMGAIEENYVLRSELEKLALTKSYPSMTKEDIAALETLVQEMDSTRDTEKFVQHNVQFHKELMKHCEWKRLATFIQVLWNGYSQQTPDFLQGQMEKSNDDHRKIVQALKADDPDGAAILLCDHIAETGKRLILYIKSNSNSK
ncbi:GntR family transcriptional regulator [Shouchella shacheensis]|uniref:GntR family transcriptional regulator n=1 Tax=Shouchella shacheensis TaxID=1649580 RepID=UPI000ABDE328|nr:GntR family transcriptional regulator [Shouchella shacheensis]